MLNMGILCSWDCIWNKIICLLSIFSADFYLVKGFDLLNILNLKGSYRKGLTCPKWAGRNRNGPMIDRLSRPVLLSKIIKIFWWDFSMQSIQGIDQAAQSELLINSSWTAQRLIWNLSDLEWRFHFVNLYKLFFNYIILII